jgi:uncharacterized protein (UPF0147 family)
MKSQRLAVGIAAFLALGVLNPPPASAVTPDSPEVKSTINKALKYLEHADDPRLGGKCLIGMAFLKNGADESHPKIQAAIAACQAHAKGDAASIHTDIYSTGIAIIFLCSVNPSKYAPEIIKYKESLESRQKPHGGWGYPDKPTGDTSMTQYAVLAYWEMQSVGLPPSVSSTEKVANWILRTQDPNGGWGYQGKEGETLGSRLDLVKQDGVRQGMSAAGLGCTYMVADLLKLSEFTVTPDASLPEALRPVLQGGQKALTDKVDLRQIRAAQSRGKDWMKENYKIDPGGFVHYWLYALERYQSFREAAEGNRDSAWYNDGYRYLRETQERDGSWPGTTENMEAVNTAFGALFLLRSTKKAIERSKSFGAASLLAGRGLPGAATEVRIRAGQIVPKEVTLSASQMIDTLHQPESPQYSGVAADVVVMADQIQAAPATDQAEYLSKLRALASGGARDARLAAVQVLGKLRDIESGPALILALDDPDWQIAQAADQALQLLGRRISATPLGDSPDPAARDAAKAGWKKWYLAVRPDAEFDN